MIDLRVVNPVPHDRIEGWATSAEGQAARQRVGPGVPSGSPRRARPMRIVAVAAALVLALVASVVLLRSGNDSTTPAARRSLVERLAHGEWKSLDAGPATGLSPDGSATVWTGRELIVWGLRSRFETSEGAAFDPAHATWRMLPDAQLGARFGAVVQWTGNEMLVIGGSDPRLNYQPPTDGAAYDPATNTWRPIAAAPFLPTPDSQPVWAGDELIMVNQTDSGPAAASYDPRTDSWQALPDPPVSLRDNEAIQAAWTGLEVVYVLPSGTVADRAAVAYEPKRRTWRQLPVPFAQDGFGTTGLVRDRRSVAYVGWPGEGGSAAGELRWARLDAVRGEWVPGPRALSQRLICSTSLSPIPRGAAVFCSVGQMVGVDFVSGRWHAFPRPPGGLPRSVTWTGRELLAFTGAKLLVLEPAIR